MKIGEFLVIHRTVCVNIVLYMCYGKKMLRNILFCKMNYECVVCETTKLGV